MGRAGALPPGYFVDSAEVSAPFPSRLEESDGEFTFAIRRDVPNMSSARLLSIAEATYPPRDLLVGIAATKGFEMGPDSAGVSLWWCDGVGAARVPYAVTTGAIEYYQGLTELYRKRSFREAGTRPLFGSVLVYHASIARLDTFSLRGRLFRDVHVARLKLSWSYDDGTFVPSCALDRVLVLAPDGDVLAVEGDGTAAEKVTFSKHRGIGRQERLFR